MGKQGWGGSLVTEVYDVIEKQMPSLYCHIQGEVRVSKKLCSVASAEASLLDLTKCVQDQKEVWSLLFEAMSVSVRQGALFSNCKQHK